GCIKTKDDESAERLARTTTRQPLTNGTRTGNQTPRRRNTLSDTGRDTGNHSGLLLPARDSTAHRVCRRPSPSWNSTDGERRRTTNSTTEKRIQNLGVMLRRLLGQEKRPSLRRNLERPRSVGLS